MGTSTPAPPPELVSRLRAAGCVFAEDEAQLLVEAAHTPAELSVLADRRISGLPLEQVLGWAQFAGLRIIVEPGVFVPRRRTEFLTAQAGALVHPGAVVLDLCCGAGAVGAVLATRCPEIELSAADIDPAAVRCARRNLPRAAEVYLGDLYQPLPAALRGRVEVLAANVPYVPSAAIAMMPPEARDHEPRTALDGGADGLDVLRRVAAGAPEWLAPGGQLLVETSVAQVAAAAAAFTAAGLGTRVSRCAELDATVVVGEWLRPAN